MHKKILSVIISTILIILVALIMYLYFAYPKTPYVKFCEYPALANYTGPSTYRHPYLFFIQVEINGPCLKPDGWEQLN